MTDHKKVLGVGALALMALALPAWAQEAATEVAEAVAEALTSVFGIPPENLSRIFDPFFTTQPQGEGTGLGLYICQGIVQRMGGEIRIESREGVGTVARVLLPLSPPARLVERPPTVGVLPPSALPARG